MACKECSGSQEIVETADSSNQAAGRSILRAKEGLLLPFSHSPSGFRYSNGVLLPDTEAFDDAYPPLEINRKLWCELFIICSDDINRALTPLDTFLRTMSECALDTRLSAPGRATVVNAYPTAPNPNVLQYTMGPTPNGQILHPATRMVGGSDGAPAVAFINKGGQGYRFTAVLVYSCHCNPEPRLGWERKSAEGAFLPDPPRGHDEHMSAITCNPKHAMAISNPRIPIDYIVCAIAATDTPTVPGAWRVTGIVKWKSKEGSCEPQECKQQTIVKIESAPDGTLKCSVS